jgi:hypothetical protein
MRILYFDCFAGISGDMALGAFLDLGVSLTDLQEAVAGLGIRDLSLGGEKNREKRHCRNLCPHHLSRGSTTPSYFPRYLRVARKILAS